MFDSARERIRKLEETNATFAKFTQHIEDHQMAYVAFGTSAITALVMKVGMKPQTITVINEAPSIAPIFNNLPVFHNTVNNGGHMRKIVKCLETNELWLSVSDAARAQEKNVSLMSQHLNHPDVVSEINGLHFAIEALTAG